MLPFATLMRCMHACRLHAHSPLLRVLAVSRRAAFTQLLPCPSVSKVLFTLTCEHAPCTQAIANGQVENFPPPDQLKTVYVEHDIQGDLSDLNLIDYVCALCPGKNSKKSTVQGLCRINKCTKALTGENLSRHSPREGALGAPRVWIR